MSTTVFSQYKIEGEFIKDPSYEVGKPGTVDFNITSPLDSIAEIYSITWSYKGGYYGQYEQVDGYIGDNNSTSTYYVNNPSLFNTYKLYFQLTDLAPDKITLEIDIWYEDKNGVPFSISKQTELKVNTIKKPTIMGLKAVQKCCREVVKYKAVNTGYANIYEWEIEGGGEIIDEYDNIAIVKPSKDNIYHVSCKVKRAEAHPLYSKTSFINVKRSEPTTPDIEGPSYMCVGDTVSFSIEWEKVCNAYAVKWTVTTDKTQSESISNIDPNKPLNIIPNAALKNDTMNITAEVLIRGGCIAKIAELNGIPVFDYGETPEPDGIFKIDINWLDSNRCDPYIMYLAFIPSGPTNGIISVTPDVFHGFPHHTEGRSSIMVDVCYANPCTRKQNCKTFEVPLPAPCEDPPMLKNNNRKEIISEESIFIRGKTKKTRNTTIVDNLLIYPNPFSTNVTITSNKSSIKEIKIYDINGRLVYEQEVNTFLKKIPMDEMATGVYFISVQTEDDLYVQKIVSTKQ